MVTIESDGQSVTADTLEAASRALKAARRRELQEQRRKAADYELAELRASKAAITILNAVDRKLNQPGAFPGWIITHRESESIGDRQLFHNRVRSLPRLGSLLHVEVSVEAEHGTAVFTHVEFIVDALIWNGSGFTVGAMIRNEATGLRAIVAYGVSADQVAMVSLPSFIVPMCDRAFDVMLSPVE